VRKHGDKNRMIWFVVAIQRSNVSVAHELSLKSYMILIFRIIIFYL